MTDCLTKVLLLFDSSFHTYLFDKCVKTGTAFIERKALDNSRLKDCRLRDIDRLKGLISIPTEIRTKND